MTLCRLCNAQVARVFQKTQLQKYLVQYQQCSHCDSLQTETPYWLDHAYQDLNFAKDTGMVARSIFVAKLTLALALKERFSASDEIIDFGAGTGLVTRMLRDYGLNAWWHDKYAKNIFSIGFEKEIESPTLICAFEVFEHLNNPQEQLATLFNTTAPYILFSTKLYQGQGLGWWYLLEDGQHVQFYSKKGLQHLASAHGYHFTTDGSTYHLFSKKILPKNYMKKRCHEVGLSKIEKRAKKLLSPL